MAINSVSSVGSPAGRLIDLEAGTSGPASIAAPTIVPSGEARLSSLTRAPSRPAPRPPADGNAPAQTAHAAAPGRLQQLGAYGGPVLDAAASGLSMAASRLSAAPRTAGLTETVSGALWAGGAAINQLGNVPANALVSGANAVGAAAGVLSAVAPSLTGSDNTSVAYASAAAWAVNGGANLLRAANDAGRALPSRVLQGVSGAANMAAAGLAAAATVASQQNAPLKAVNLGTASSVAWGIGAFAALGSAWTAAPRDDASVEAAPAQPQRSDAAV
ncbi:hypothetical protein EYC55_04170 [Xanthomonas oryzae]|uniref:hypothetical protein n=1 Tax=Xanthomonas oryzae TaxID=347 RepID=UPI00103399E2|nr:hypothetical protein [Xanthomonas oryzae]QBG94839.1 hypothetical protein EYC55_04170 [Xanthomonas oryzae]